MGITGIRPKEHKSVTGWPQTWKTQGIWKIVKISGKI